MKNRCSMGIFTLVACLFAVIFFSVCTFADTTTEQAFKNYNTFLAKKSEKASFCIIYLTNDNIPDMVYFTEPRHLYDEWNDDWYNYVSLFINGNQAYITGDKEDFEYEGMYDCYYIPKSSVFLTYDWNEVKTHQLLKIETKYDLVPMIYENVHDNSCYQTVWYSSSGSYRWYDSIRKMYYNYSEISKSKYDTLYNQLHKGKAYTPCKMVTNTAAHRKAYLKGTGSTTTKKSQTIRVSSDNVVLTYKANGTYALNAKSSSSRTYTSSNKNVATVSSSGIVTMKGYGKTTITIKAKATSKYYSATKKINITVKPQRATLKNVTSNSVGYFTATWNRDSLADGYDVQFSTSKSFNGKKTRTVAGNSNTSYTYNLGTGGKWVYVKVRSYKYNGSNKICGEFSTVKSVKTKSAAATKIKLSQTSATINVGNSVTLKATVTGSTGTVSWSSSNTSVASVNSYGTVTGKKSGTATITAKINGVSASCYVTVKNVDIESVISKNLLGAVSALGFKHVSYKDSNGREYIDYDRWVPVVYSYYTVDGTYSSSKSYISGDDYNGKNAGCWSAYICDGSLKAFGTSVGMAASTADSILKAKGWNLISDGFRNNRGIRMYLKGGHFLNISYTGAQTYSTITTIQCFWRLGSEY